MAKASNLEATFNKLEAVLNVEKQIVIIDDNGVVDNNE